MAELRFQFTELVRETKALRTIARNFLDPSTTRVLHVFENDLADIRKGQAGRVRSLELQPLYTRPSKGEYEFGRRKGLQHVYAIISGTWELRPLGGSSAPRREVEFCGKASTKIALYNLDRPNTRLAMWRLELGAEDSPGCYIHAQILGDSDQPPFPRSVPIPRLPSIFVTPMSAVEFALGELFQDKWAKATAGNTGDTPYWRELQRKRLQSLFSWYQSELKNSVSSPWMALKESKPREDIFTQN